MKMGNTTGPKWTVRWSWAGLILAVRVTVTAGDQWTLSILHTNDVHARIDPVDTYGGSCRSANFSGCYGGVSRQVTLVKELKERRPNSTLFLNTGDYFQGAIWFYILKHKFMADVVNLIHHDAMTLGNHEFDHGSLGVYEFMSNITDTPVLGCNLDFSQDPLLKNLTLKPSIVLDVDNHKVGIIGYLTPATVYLSSPDPKTKFTDEFECIEREAKKMKKSGVQIIIALGHSGYDVDQEIARRIPDVSAVVGGHSHTFLGAENIAGDDPSGPYPTVITRKDGSKCPVVQAFWLGKYLGYINITFDTATGHALSWEGAPIVIDDTIKPDPGMEAYLGQYREMINKASDEMIGSTRVLLDGRKQTCRLRECNLGNLIADSMVNWFVNHEAGESSWGFVSAAIINGGGIRSTISETSGGEITFGDLVMVLPFDNQIWAVNVTGMQLLSILEQSISRQDPAGERSYGGFMQVSGLRVVYDVAKPPGQRVVSAKIRCRFCRAPTLEPVQRHLSYQIALTNYILQGGDNLDLSFISAENIYKSPTSDINVTQVYLAKESPLWQDTEDRIVIVYGDYSEMCPGNSKRGSALRSMPSVYIIAILAAFLSQWSF